MRVTATRFAKVPHNCHRTRTVHDCDATGAATRLATDPPKR